MIKLSDHKCYVDFETFSHSPLKDVGVCKYARDSTTDVICLAYACDDEPVQLWLPSEPLPRRLISLVNDGGVFFYAFNAEFEFHIWLEVLHKRYDWPIIPIHRWRCVQAQAAHAGLPRKLDGAAKALDLVEQKDSRGAYLINNLSKPVGGKRNCDGDLLQEMYAYCKQDVETERCVHKSLPDLPESCHEQWLLNCVVNARGLPVDRELCQSVVDVVKPLESYYQGAIHRITNGYVSSPNQTVRILDYLIRSGLVLTDLREHTVRDALLRDDLTGNQRAVLEFRQQGSSSAYTKFSKALVGCGPDGRVRNTLKYYAAITGRFGGAGFQPQNLRHGDFDSELNTLVRSGDHKGIRCRYKRPLDVISRAVRGIVRAPDGHKFVVSDLNAIELRVCAWLAEDEPLLDRLASGDDFYIPLAESIHGVAGGTFTKDSPERQHGKKALLGSIYGQGSSKFQSSLHRETGQLLPEEFCKNSIDVARGAMPGIVNYWRELERACNYCLQEQSNVYAKKTQFKWCDPWMCIELPSGRDLYYYKPYWDESGGYYGDGEWMYHGPRGPAPLRRTVLIENITQAASSDILMEDMLAMHFSGLEIVCSEHDKVIVLAADGDVDCVVNIVNRCMETNPAWCCDLPLKTETQVKQSLLGGP